MKNSKIQRIPKLQAEDQAKWWDTLGKFQKLFRKAAASLNQQGKMDNDATHNYFMSGKKCLNADDIIVHFVTGRRRRGCQTE